MGITPGIPRPGGGGLGDIPANTALGNFTNATALPTAQTKSAWLTWLDAATVADLNGLSSVVSSIGAGLTSLEEVVASKIGEDALVPYLLQSTAAATYVPRAGGTMTGDLVVPDLIVGGIDGPRLNRSGTTIRARSNDGLSDAPFSAGAITASGTLTLNSGNTNALYVVPSLVSGFGAVTCTLFRPSGGNVEFDYIQASGGGVSRVSRIGNSAGWQMRIGSNSSVSIDDGTNPILNAYQNGATDRRVGINRASVSGVAAAIQAATAGQSLIRGYNSSGVQVLDINETGNLTASGTITQDRNFNDQTSAVRLRNINAGSNAQTRIDLNNDSASGALSGGSLFYTSTGWASPYTSALGFWNYRNGPIILGTNNTERVFISASGDVGIGTNSPQGRLDVLVPSAASTRETIFRARISDAGNDAFHIYNGTIVDGALLPGFSGSRFSSNGVALIFNAMTDATNDSGTNPLMIFEAKRTSSVTDPNNGTHTAITTRPLFAWAIPGSTLMQMFANGNLALNSTTDNGARLQVAGNVTTTGNITGASSFEIAADNASGSADLVLRVGRSGNNSGSQAIVLRHNATNLFAGNNFHTVVNGFQTTNLAIFGVNRLTVGSNGSTTISGADQVLTLNSSTSFALVRCALSSAPTQFMEFGRAGSRFQVACQGNLELEFQTNNTRRMAIAGTGEVTVVSHITSAFQSLSADPSTIDIPSGSNRIVKNTTSGEVRDWVNDGGVMKKSPAYT
jgi:hypothetical protein